MDWENAYTTKKRGWPAVKASGSVVPMNLPKVVTMAWGYEPPTPFTIFGQSITRVLYATAAVEDKVFVMSAPMRTEDDPRQVASVLRRSLKTLTREPQPVDPAALAAGIKSGVGSWKGCRARGVN
jgi:hypothetical protein